MGRNPKSTPELDAEIQALEHTAQADPDDPNRDDVSQDPNWVPEHVTDVDGPIGSDVDGVA